MISLAVWTLLFGAILAMRFKVLILVPALGSVLITVVATGLVGANGLFAIAGAATLASSCLQFGYVFGAFTRFGEAPTVSHPRAVR
jgi:hypothetical protein